MANQPIKMMGVFIRLSPEDFQNMLNRNEGLAVVTTSTSFFGITYMYVTSYKGLVFYCKAKIATLHIQQARNHSSANYFFTSHVTQKE